MLLSWLTKVWVEDKVRTASLLSGHGWRSVSTALAAVVPVVLVSLFLADRARAVERLPGPDYPGAAALASKRHRGRKARPRLLPPPITEIKARHAHVLAAGLPGATISPRREGSARSGTPKDPALTVALVGDSIAGELVPPLEQIARPAALEAGHRPARPCAWTATMLIDPTTGSPYTAASNGALAALRDLVSNIKPNVVITSGLPEDGTIAHPDPERPRPSGHRRWNGQVLERS